VPPGGSATYPILVNKWLTPDKPGTYELRVRMDLRPKLRASLSTTIQLTPSSKEGQERLRAKVKEWYETHAAIVVIDLAQDAFPQEIEALDSLIYTRSPVAVPYQDKLLDRGGGMRAAETHACLVSMLAGDTDEAVRLLARRLRDPKTGTSLRLQIFYAINVWGWNQLSPSSRKLLEPFRKEIDEAAGVDAID
jgi:hypothetical protein